MAVGLVYHVRNREHALVRAVAAYADQDAWRKTLAGAGYLPVD